MSRIYLYLGVMSRISIIFINAIYMLCAKMFKNKKAIFYMPSFSEH